MFEIEFGYFMNGLKEKYLGSRNFYRNTLAIAFPIMLQNGLMNVVNLLDNLMVGRLGTEQMSGVAIAGNLLFVFQMAIFGAVSGAGIFGAQFYGKGDHKGVADSLRIKLYVGLVLLMIGEAILFFKKESLINLYLRAEVNDVAKAAMTLEASLKYMRIMMISLPFQAAGICYSSSLRECGKTRVPLYAGIAAVITDLVLNWLLIFGNLGFPKLGVEGAAIATVISRIVDCMINIIWTHTHSSKMPYARYLFKKVTVPGALLKQVTIKGLPLMMNEIFWVLSITYLNQIYSEMGLDVVAANNISVTLSNVFNILFIALGSAVGIMVGQELGKGLIEKARSTARKLIFFSVISTFGVGLVMIAVSGLFPRLYQTTDVVRELASKLIAFYAVAMPIMAFNHASYFAIRSGGKTFITLVLDSVYCWTVTVPIAYVLVNYTSINIAYIYLMVQLSEITKCVVATIFLKKLNWAVNLVEKQQS